MDLALNNQQWLICHKTKLNQTKLRLNKEVPFEYLEEVVLICIERVAAGRLRVAIGLWTMSRK